MFDYDTLKIRLRETAFLTKNLKIILRDNREEKHEHVFHYEGGIKEFVTYLNRGKSALYDQVFYCEGSKDGVYVEISMPVSYTHLLPASTFIAMELIISCVTRYFNAFRFSSVLSFSSSFLSFKSWNGIKIIIFF